MGHDVDEYKPMETHWIALYLSDNGGQLTM